MCDVCQQTHPGCGAPQANAVAGGGGVGGGEDDDQVDPLDLSLDGIPSFDEQWNLSGMMMQVAAALSPQLLAP